MRLRQLLVCIFVVEAICYLTMWYFHPEKTQQLVACVMQ